MPYNEQSNNDIAPFQDVLHTILCAFFCIISILPAAAQDDGFAVNDSIAWPSAIRARLDSLMTDPLLETTTVAMAVYDLTADSMLYARGERQRVRPASTMKMITAVAALTRLGADHPVTTRLATTGQQDGATLHGDLYCRGDFDAAFSSDDLAAMVDSLAAMGIDTIAGDIYADLSMKDTLRLGEGWCWDDDNPTLSPLTVDGKDNFLAQLARRLRNKGICWQGNARTGRTPRSARTLWQRQRTLGQLLPRMMKQSDNFYAEAVFYHLAAAECGRQTPATARHGRQAINRMVNDMGLRAKGFRIADGSGLSLYNYVSPALEIGFLREAFRCDSVYLPLLASMPIAATDGTLAKRMRHTAAAHNVRAKTGTVTGVSALAGYLQARNGHTLAFAIINMGVEDADDGRRFQDKVCEALCE